MERTYMDTTGMQTRIYRVRHYGGVDLEVYVPSVYYRPAFYAWELNRWSRGMRYAFSGSMALAMAGGGVQPYAVYNSPSQWLTDYALAATLRTADDMQDGPGETNPDFQAGPPADDDSVAGPGAPLPIEIKQMIGSQVQGQIEAEQNQAATPGAQTTDSSTPPLDPALRVFLVSTPMDVVTDGRSCALTPGDVLFLPKSVELNASEAQLLVMSARRYDCPSNTEVTIQIIDLQEMHNHFAATIDDGQEELAARDSETGLPKAPDAETKPTVEARGARALNAGEVQSAIVQAQEDATKVEQKVQQEAEAGN